jgi:multiple antibiotic resistance protein
MTKNPHACAIMAWSPISFSGVDGGFLLGFPSLFSIVNPLGSALIFSQVLADRTRAERAVLARRVALYALIVLLVSLWAGSHILHFFGVTIAALRLAGGAVVASRAWAMLNAPETHEASKEAQATPARLSDDAAFYPLTMPFTTGPGTIAVAIALTSAGPRAELGSLAFMGGMSAAAICIATIVWVTYRYADYVLEVLGPSGARVVSRLIAFLLLCIGTQIMINGWYDLAK